MWRTLSCVWFLGCVWPCVCGAVACVAPVRVGFTMAGVAVRVWGGRCGGVGARKGGPVAGPPFFLWCAGGGVLLSHTLAGAVPSALAVLASGFGKGKGPGVSLPLWPPPRLPGLIVRPP